MSNLDKAFRAIKRADFLPAPVKAETDYDVALPIGYGQTNSQPYTVRLMLMWLDARRGDKILDVGSGSGWTTALLAYLVGPKGVVYAVERIPELVKFGAKNCQRLGLKNVHFYKAGKDFGLPQFAPYARILVSASAPALPGELIAQLKPGGRLVIPIRSSVCVIDKTTVQDFTVTKYPGFVFVPLI